MLKRFLGILALILFAGSIALLPRVAYGDTGTPPSLSITQAEISIPDPVAVGNSSGPFVEVYFAVNVNDGNEQNESGPVSVKNQQYTISGGGGMITSVAAPEGYTVGSIPSSGISTATVTGDSETSFTIEATLFFPQIAAGDDTVSCSGFLTLSDGTQVGSNPNGSAPVTAVAVDSVTLKPDSSTQTIQTSVGSDTETFNYQIGQKITQSDFTITTTPSGYGGNSSLVSFSPSSFPLVIGDNNVTATCGVSKKNLDVVGFQCTGAWGSVTGPADGTGNIMSGYTAEVQGGSGSYSISGPGLTSGGTAGGSLADGIPVAYSVGVNPGSVDAGFTDTLTIQPANVSGSLAGSPGISPTNSASTANAANSLGEVLAGNVLDTIKELYFKFSGAITSPKQNPYTLTESLKASAADVWSQKTVTALATGTVNGNFYWILPVPLYCQSPHCYLVVSSAVKTVTDTTTGFIYNVDVDADLFSGGPVLGGTEGIQFNMATLFNVKYGGEFPLQSEYGWSKSQAVDLDAYTIYGVLSDPFDVLGGSGQWNGPQSIGFVYQWE